MKPWTRRDMLMQTVAGFDSLALRWMLGKDARAFAAPLPALQSASSGTPRINPLAPKPPQFTAKAKSVIFLFMYGGPNHLDLFDPKPALDKYAGKPIPTFK